MVHPLIDSQQPGDALDVLAVVTAMNAGDVARDVDVALRGQRGQQVELLEDESDFLLAYPGACRVRQGSEIDAID